MVESSKETNQTTPRLTNTTHREFFWNAFRLAVVILAGFLPGGVILLLGGLLVFGIYLAPWFKNESNDQRFVFKGLLWTAVGICALLAFLYLPQPPTIGDLYTRLVTQPPTQPPTSAVPTSSPVTSSTQEGIRPEGEINVKITPHVIVKRFPQRGEVQSFSLYGFSIVLYVRNGTSSAKNIRQVEIVGEVPLDVNEYVSFEKEGMTIDEIEAEWLRRKPYYSISLVAYPKQSGHIDPYGAEGFIEFDFIEPLQTFGMRMWSDAKEDYVGYKDRQLPPKRLTTEPNLKDLVKFSSKSSGKYQEWQGPTLRDELVNGHLSLIVLVDSVRVTITPKKINKVQWTLAEDWKERNPQDLYFLGEYGHPIDRTKNKKDPAVQRR